ncbi:MAG: NUDIX hydrolase [Marivivens sp.]|nr:NUDIX hydrolase [Marivivens sp.]
MTDFFRTAWSELLSPFLRRPPMLQMAALCHRDGADGREVLLITSSSGNWILPKGWPIEGTNGGGTALREAFEEAGVAKGAVAKSPIARVETVKRFDDGNEAPCTLEIYPVAVEEMTDDYPESDRRERRWVPVSEAANLVSEPALAEAISAL